MLMSSGFSSCIRMLTVQSGPPTTVKALIISYVGGYDYYRVISWRQWRVEVNEVSEVSEVSLAVAHPARQIDILHKHPPTRICFIRIHQMQVQHCIESVGRRSTVYLTDLLPNVHIICGKVISHILCSISRSPTH